jgi:hypothetical protein
MITSGAPSPIRRYASSAPDAGTVPVRAEAVDISGDEYLKRTRERQRRRLSSLANPRRYVCTLVRKRRSMRVLGLYATRGSVA